VLTPRNVTWNSNYAMLYIDNPVGVGFSYTGDNAGYSLDEDAVALNLYTALVLFFSTYSNYASNDFYITGESYAGKYLPALGYKIYSMNNQNPSLFINLKGVGIGDGLCDPASQLTAYADLAYNAGLADENEQRIMHQYQDDILALIEGERWMDAALLFEELVDGPPDYFQNITGSGNYYDYRKSYTPSYGGDYSAYLNQSSIRQSLHVGNHYFDQNSNYAGFLLTIDLCKTVKRELSTLVENYKVLFYNGQFDFIVGAPLTEAMLRILPWSGLDAYQNAPKSIWRLDASLEYVAGYVRTAAASPLSSAGVTQVIVRDAGHLLPFDQPERAWDMIYRWIENIPF